MALIKDTSFTIPGYGDVPAPGTYWMIDNIRLNQRESVLRYSMVGWKDAATRETYRSAQTDFIAKVTAKNEAEAALAAQIPGSDDKPGSDSLKAKEDASGPLRTALTQAEREHMEAAQKLIAIVPFQAIERSIPIEEVALYVKDSQLDYAQLYAREKATTDFANATDA